ncbi:hypothetical protein GCM10018793_68280 [Streptomyces sulfonofaciens]|uniref:Mycothiol-dependent maleylpyruvate isomerase metal-binding domain-containing protein n=1 Tax=Streptomyces sulfonofaciens TaxID=68272 RepID=A0A919GPP9_9ACTN|nr:maleylpyruvate isomerase N-terminal domain-containing protein [Streptomyces sulfonofaciens]GHH88477.1 hypothetical protein GCM10018793_68280 [Streptomyces sulfonofaciens]
MTARVPPAGAPNGAERWLRALRASSERLSGAAGTLTKAELERPSMAAGWSVAAVLSHLGSAAEICANLLERGIAGDERGPVRKELEPVWERWNALPPLAQREAWRAADARHLGLLGSLGRREHESVRVPYFAGLLSVPNYIGYRLSEQSLHAWDVEAALHPGKAIPAPEVALLWERLDLVATRFRNPGTLLRLAPAQLTVALTDPARTLLLDLGAELHLYPCEPSRPVGAVTGTAEAVLRLVYGRNRLEDDVRVSGALALDDLRSLFPGF